MGYLVALPSLLCGLAISVEDIRCRRVPRVWVAVGCLLQLVALIVAALWGVVVWWLAMGVLGLVWMLLWRRFDWQGDTPYTGKVPFAPVIVVAAAVALGVCG